MADVKISALPAATTPLVGTEVLPIVQSSTTKKVAISDLTAGRVVSASSLTLTTPLAVTSGGTGLASGTSGGIPYYISTTAIASSAALEANALVIGGGAGSAPATTTTAAGVLTFLGAPTSANLAATVTDETGTGALVFGTSPSITTPTIVTSATGPLFIGGTTVSSSLTLQSTSGVGTSDSIIFKVGNNGATTAATINTSGNMGIGTTAPNTRLTVTTSSVTPPTPFSGSNVNVFNDSGPTRIWLDSFGDISHFDGRSAGGTATSPTASPSGQGLVGMFAFGRGATGYHTSGNRGAIQYLASETWTDTAQGSYFTLSTSLTGTTSVSERLRVDPAGNILIGTTTSPTTGTQCLTLGTGTAATATAADTITVFSTDLSAGNTILSLRTEGTPVNANTTAAATHRIAIRVNGTVYYLLANTSA